MKLTKFKLQQFKSDFNKKTREDVSDKEKFKTLKLELIDHLSQFDEKIKSLPNLKLYIEGFSLCMSYLEENNQTMKIRFIWKINDMTKEDVIKIMEDFGNNVLKIDSVPNLLITNSFMYQNLSIYWPNQNQIDISTQTINQLSEELVEKVIKHEMIHAYLSQQGKDASDTSPHFVRLIHEHNAYVSTDPSAKQAYDDYVSSLKEK